MQGPFVMLTPIMTAERRREEGMKIWKEGRSRRRGMKILREVIINSLWIVMYIYASHLACVWTRPFNHQEYTAQIFSKLVVLNVKPLFIWLHHLWMCQWLSSTSINLPFISLALQCWDRFSQRRFSPSTEALIWSSPPSLVDNRIRWIWMVIGPENPMKFAL